MRQSPDRRFALPARRRAPWWLWVGAVLVHIPVVLLLIRISHRFIPRERDDRDAGQAIALSRAVPMIAPRAFRRLPPQRESRPPAGRSGVSGAMPAPVQAPLVTPTQVGPPPRTPQSIAATPTDTAQGQPHGIVTPQYGNGSLWVRPLPLTPRELAQVMKGRTGVAQAADSQVSELVQEYLDEMAREKLEKGPPLPSWTTTVGGKKLGLDSKWVYLGPIKLPTALLGFLPILQNGNPTQYEFAKQLNQMREDLFDAARRSATYEDFKQAVKEMRQQKLDEQEFKKNQRTRPDTGKGG